MKLYALIEFKHNNHLLLDGGEEVRVYHVYEGDFVNVISDSANAYWQTREQYEEYKRPYSAITDTAKYRVLADDVYVGHWATFDEVLQFVRLYMRGTISVIVYA